MNLRFKLTTVIYLSFITFKALAFNDASIGIDVSVLPGTIGVIGNGSADSPYNFTALTNNLLTLRYTFTNYGPQPAYRFVVITNNLPTFKAGIIQETSTCPYGKLPKPSTTLYSIGQGDNSCVMDITVPKASLFDTIAHSHNNRFPLTQGAFPLNMAYIYDGSNQYDTPTVYVGYTRDWVNPQIAKEVYVVDKGKYTEATVNLTINPDNRLVNYPITATASGQVLSFIEPDSIRSCQIANSINNNCILTLKFPKSVYSSPILQSGLFIDIEFITSSMNSKDKVTHQITVKI